MKALALKTFATLALLGSSLATHAQYDRTAAFAKLPDWRGVWIADGFEPGISGFAETLGTSDAKPHPLTDPQAPWTDEGRKRLSAIFANQGARKSMGWGYPMMMKGPAPLEFLITPEETLIVNIIRKCAMSTPMAGRIRRKKTAG